MMSERIFHLAKCMDCGDFADTSKPMIMPFSREAERDGWLKAHAAATGHEVIPGKEKRVSFR